MAALPGGSFSQPGLGEQGAKVEPFCLDVTEVTVAAYRACVKTGKCSEPSPVDDEAANMLCNWNRAPNLDAHPINCVQWAQAKDYCVSLGKRLPTEVEWEWAARGGEKGWKHPWGNDAPTEKRLNACGTECADPADASDHPLFPASDGYRSTAPVGSFPATEFGLKDIVGNVWEWTAFEVGDVTRFARGGGYEVSDAEYVSTKALIRYNPKKSWRPTVGFRCAK
jgi:formylglycine-generating enzyme required for sulfatase activity